MRKERTSINETIRILQQLDWLDEKISETGECIGFTPGGFGPDGSAYLGSAAMDQRHKVYEYLKGRLMAAVGTDVVELYTITDGLHGKELKAWLEEHEPEVEEGR